MLIKRFFNDPALICLIFSALLLHIFSLNPDWVERYYSQGIYPGISFGLRTLLGWIPFSLGDIVYFFAGLFLAISAIRLIKTIRKRQANGQFWIKWVRSSLRVILTVYLLFNILWGLNYNRKGIGYQLQISVNTYQKEELEQLTNVLQQRLNAAAIKMNEEDIIRLNSNKNIHELGIESYEQASNHLPFLRYKRPSIKTSLFTHVGHFFGFTGYYNPISGEAQLKSTVPRFLQPFIVNHEIAHQVGYAKENEANFVAYLTGRRSSFAVVQYATYFEAYLYAIRDLGRSDTAMVKNLHNTLHPQAKADFIVLMEYLVKNENRIEPYISRFYDQFLKLNKQPKGTRTYNEVVAWLLAYMKKYGAESI